MQASQEDILPVVDPSAIPVWNLFGKKAPAIAAKPTTVKPPPVVEVEVADAPETRLKLTLMGVFAHIDESRSTAIIAERRDSSKLYRIGDVISGGASLAGVFGDKVLLKIRGKLEVLYFPDPGSDKKKSQSSKRKPSERRSRRSSARKSNKGKSSISKMMVGGPKTPSEITSIIKEQLGSDVAGALNDLGLAQNDGNGYKVSSENNPIFSALGMKTGDVILSLNGMSLGDPENDVSAIPEAMQSGGGDCKVEIRKADGRQYSQTVPCGGF